MKIHEAEFVLSIDNGGPLIIIEVKELNNIDNSSCSIKNNFISLTMINNDVVNIGPFSETQISMVSNKKIPCILMDTSSKLILDVQLIHVI